MFPAEEEVYKGETKILLTLRILLTTVNPTF